MKNFSEIVHDVIGHDPILDQYDLSYPASFYHTTQDDYVTGSLLTVSSIKDRRGLPILVEGNRGRLFSKLQANSQPALDNTLGSPEVIKNPSYAERLVPWSEKVSNSYRFSQCVDEKERFYDSCLPDIKSCLDTDNTPLWTTHDNPLYWLSPYGNVKTSSVGYLIFNGNPIAVNKNLTNDVWTWSFPFEERYSTANRQISTQEVLGINPTNTTTNWYPNSFTELSQSRSIKQIKSFFPLLPGRQQINTVDTSFRVDTNLPENSFGSYRILIPSDVDLNQQNPVSTQLLTGTMSNDDMIKFLFGFGDLNNISYTSYNLNEDEESILSSSYFTGFELKNWTGGINPSSGLPYSFNSSSYNGNPIIVSGSAPTYFNAQFDQPSGSVIVKWIAPIPVGAGNGLQAESIYRGIKSTQRIDYNEFPWLMIARQNFISSSFNDQDQIEVYNYVSQSSYYSYALGNTSSARGEVLTGSSAIYWTSSSNPSRHWVLASFKSASYDGSFWEYFTMPDPAFTNGRTISSQKVDVTSSYPWKLSYQRAVSAHVSDYFRSSFSGMPGFPSSLGNVDVEIEKIFGTDVPFEGTQRIETTPQILTDFTSSLLPPGEYQIKFSYVKTGASGSSNRIDRAFIDNINILTFAENQLTGNFIPSSRIGYSHYPKFRQIVRDTRTSPYFPGEGFKSISRLYSIQRLRQGLVQDASSYLQSDSYGGYEFGFSPVIRGWKYGIYSGFPAHSRIIFRRNKFGQFRDMLEQRQFSKFINLDKSSSENIVRGGTNLKLNEKSNLAVQEGPVTVKFVRQEASVDANGLGKISTITIDPTLTTSQNLSAEATSAIPFFDGENKESNNRLNPDGSPKTEMVMLTAATPEFISSVPALTTVIPPSNLTITTRR